MSIIATITPIETHEVEELKKYARRCVHHGLKVIQEGSPFHPYLMYNQMFNQNIEKEQKLINALGSAWLKDSQEIHVYSDLGINDDMVRQIDDILSFKSNTPIYMTSLKNKLKIPVDFSIIKEKNNNSIIIDKKLINNYKLDYEFNPKSNFANIKGSVSDNNHFMDFTKVIMESPFAGDVENNVLYAKSSIRYLATDKIAPSASHLMYTQMLDDNLPDDRKQGIDKGIDIAHNIDSIFMVDRGLSGGMKYGYDRAIKEGRKVYFRTLSSNPEVIKEVDKIKNWKEAELYISKLTNQNRKLYEDTGYIHDDVCQKINKHKISQQKNSKQSMSTTKKAP